ncbi:DUF6334 family protein [Parvularcula sp. IMCC14364]|uniref:DUF6334 family protein n=1 Tax=Parvularcula sp. IMCC14364 TaxID=3067902 RepID=UPI002741FEE5|nr:DUF6334 family protein [Parvularcula sp. IMCC14364]
MLQFDWEEVNGLTITEILADHPCKLSDGTFSAEALYFVNLIGIIEIVVNWDTDELIIRLLKTLGNKRFLTDINSHFNVVGKRLAWSWEAKNYLGYSDMFLLAFGEVVPKALQPQLAFIGAASSISVLSMSPLHMTEPAPK